MLSVLDLLSAEQPTCTAVEVGEALGCSRTTSYRYLKTLTDAGLLAPQPGGRFSLGARIIELDRQIRLSDPLLVAAEPQMRSLSTELNLNAFVCSYYKDAVVCIAQAAPLGPWRTSWGRGKPMPLMRGAAGKVILAHLPTNTLKNLALSRPDDLRAAKLGETWEEFRAHLRHIRRAGFALTVAEVDPETAGLAAPLFDADGRILGSLTLSIPVEMVDDGELSPFSEPLIRAAEAITDSLAEVP
ncbi:IclR family transcriptional regulator [Georgenia ruanii]|nr:IclR family transcriptional regulator [Georgenia ruanii]MPV90362.1 helix-turn-helix domain-containing protein [Georgenia ruanii]